MLLRPRRIAKWLLASGAKIDSPLRDTFKPEISKILFAAGASKRSIVHVRERYEFDKRGFGDFYRSPIRALLCSGRISHERWRESLSITKSLYDSDEPKLSNCGCTICVLDETTSASLKEKLLPRMHPLYNSMDDPINYPVFNPIRDVISQPISDMVLHR